MCCTWSVNSIRPPLTAVQVHYTVILRNNLIYLLEQFSLVIVWKYGKYCTQRTWTRAAPLHTSPDSILCSLWPCRRRGGRGRQWWWMVVMRRTIIIRLRASRLLGPDPMLQLLLLHPLSETKCIAVGFSHQSVCFIFPDTSFQTTNFGLIPSE